MNLFHYLFMSFGLVTLVAYYFVYTRPWKSNKAVCTIVVVVISVSQ